MFALYMYEALNLTSRLNLTTHYYNLNICNHTTKSPTRNSNTKELTNLTHKLRAKQYQNYIQ